MTTQLTNSRVSAAQPGDKKLSEYRQEPEKIILKKQPEKITIASSRDAYEIIKQYARKDQEHFIVLLLTGRNELISWKPVFIGTLEASLFHPREIYRYALQHRSSKIIVAHNHPSGNLEPSENDKLMTRQVKEAGEIIGIKMVDSLIISGEGYYSIMNL
ncbi:MAG: JAB domain-containing protein [Candidatus Dojkabacteria bacterium]